VYYSVKYSVPIDWRVCSCDTVGSVGDCYSSGAGSTDAAGVTWQRTDITEAATRWLPGSEQRQDCHRL